MAKQMSGTTKFLYEAGDLHVMLWSYGAQYDNCPSLRIWIQLVTETVPLYVKHTLGFEHSPSQMHNVSLATILLIL